MRPRLAGALVCALLLAGAQPANASPAFAGAVLAPALTISTPAEGSFTNDTTPLVSGTAGDAAGDGAVFVDVYPTATASGAHATVEATRTGTTWSVVTPVLTEGPHAVVARQSDGEGAEGESPVRTFTVDVTPPAVQILSPEDGATVDITGRPSVSGTAGTAPGDEPVVAVSFSGGPSGVEGFEASGVGGTWEGRSDSASLKEGGYLVRAQQTDAAGNVGEDTAGFSVDRSGPSPTITRTAGDDLLSTKRPTFSGTLGNGPGDLPAVTVEFLDGPGPATLDGVVDGTAWTATPATDLADGTYRVRAYQDDELGHRGYSNEREFVIDTTGPLVTYGAPAVTNDATPAISGTAGRASAPGAADLPVVDIVVRKATAAVATLRAVVDDSGHFSAEVPAALVEEGTYAVEVEQSDSLGNVGSDTGELRLDVTAPQVTVVAPAAGAHTSDLTPEITGTAGAGTGDGAVSVDIYPSGAATGPHVTLAAARTGATWSVTVPALAPGVHTIVARQSDDAGNQGSSPPRTLIVNGSDVVTPEPTPTPTATPAPTPAPVAVLPDTVAPRVLKLVLGGSTLGRLVSARGVRVGITLDEPASVLGELLLAREQARRLRLTGEHRRVGGRAYVVVAGRQAVRPGERLTLRIVAWGRARTVLRRQRQVRLRLRLVVTDAGGNSSTETRSLRLRGRR